MKASARGRKVQGAFDFIRHPRMDMGQTSTPKVDAELHPLGQKGQSLVGTLPAWICLFRV